MPFPLFPLPLPSPDIAVVITLAVTDGYAQQEADGGLVRKELMAEI